jgi:uncharacterized Ntn-hydrolase superfamily protein
LGRVAQASTFSVVAHDQTTGDYGIAVQSRFIAVGSVVPWAKAKVGAVATQAWANVSYGPRGLDLLSKGVPAKDVIEQLTSDDERREHRQIGVVDAQGRAAAFTGKECLEWAGHTIGSNFCCQGNILTGEQVIRKMAEAYESSSGDFIDRLLACLEAAQAAGGDRRGQQSAALLIVREKGGYEGYTDKYVDIRVDDHPRPIAELERIFKLYDLTFLTREDQRNLLKVEGALAAEIQTLLVKLGFYKGEMSEVFDAETKLAYRNYINTNNFENKLREDDFIWRSVLDYMREQAAAGSR